MANLVWESRLNIILEDLIREAEEQLTFFCPYFKLHDRLKDCLKLRKEDHKLEITIIFGKNEGDLSKSLSSEDFEFLKSFPNIVIAYEKRLHAKYYSNEKHGLITSLNLHAYSQNNNIEVGVFFKTKNLLKNFSNKALGGLTSILSDTEDIAKEAAEFFYNVFINAEKIFEKEPQYESGFLGIQRKYTGSKVLIDESKKFFGQNSKSTENLSTSKSNDYYKSRNTTQNTTVKYNRLENGFCIRSGITIPFNPAKPLSWDAYQSWVQYSNMEYTEKFCHGCGRNWRTSVKTPLCPTCIESLES